MWCFTLFYCSERDHQEGSHRRSGQGTDIRDQPETGSDNTEWKFSHSAAMFAFSFCTSQWFDKGPTEFRLRSTDCSISIKAVISNRRMCLILGNICHNIVTHLPPVCLVPVYHRILGCFTSVFQFFHDGVFCFFFFSRRIGSIKIWRIQTTVIHVKNCVPGIWAGCRRTVQVSFWTNYRFFLSK